MSMQEAAMNARAAMNSLCTISRICRDLAHPDSASAADRSADLAALIRDMRCIRQTIEKLRERTEVLMTDCRQGDTRPLAVVAWRSGDSRS